MIDGSTVRVRIMVCSFGFVVGISGRRSIGFRLGRIVVWSLRSVRWSSRWVVDGTKRLHE